MAQRSPSEARRDVADQHEVFSRRLQRGLAMPESLDPNELREVAKFVEETSLDALTSYVELSFPPVVGDMQNFPRSAPEERAAVRGFDVLREEVEATVAVLYALAVASENRLPVPITLQVRVEPFINMFRIQREQQAAERDDAQGEQEQRAQEVGQ